MPYMEDDKDDDIYAIKTIDAHIETEDGIRVINCVLIAQHSFESKRFRILEIGSLFGFEMIDRENDANSTFVIYEDMESTLEHIEEEMPKSEYLRLLNEVYEWQIAVGIISGPN